MAKTTPAQRFARIFELFLNGATGEREAAERKVNAWLKQHGKTRADIKAILAQAAADDAAAAPSPRPSDPRDAGASTTWEDLFRANPTVTPLDLIHSDWESYMALQSSHEYVIASCWTLHCFVYDHFMVTPRLLWISPMENTGKTTALDVLSRLTPNLDFSL